MLKHAFIVLLSCASIGVAFAGSSTTAPHPTQAGAKNEPVDKRPEVAEMLEKLSKHVKERGKEDTEAVALIAQIEAEFGKSGPKDQKDIVKAISKCVEAPRQEPKKGEFNDKLAIAAADALGAMGPESVQPLINWIGHKSLRKDIQLQRHLILALGKTRDKDAVKTLMSNLDNKDAPLVAAAAEGIGEFGDAKVDVRKELFSAVIKCLMTAKNSRDAEASGSGATAHTNIATERYDVISAPLLSTLKVLSRHEESTPELWERWWNKNRQANWESSNP